MQQLMPLELKKALIAQGFEVYRTLPDRIALAERVRDNLLMDGNVAACTGEYLSVRFTTRAQQSAFPNDDEGTLLGRARAQGELSLARGYVEVDCAIVPIYDPGDSSRTLDTWFEVTFAREVGTFDDLVHELRFALGLEKCANR
jgi:hypothetical protein